MDFTKNREFFFTVTVRELEFSRREFQIPRLIHSIFHSWRETNQITPCIFLTGVNLSRREIKREN